MAISTFLIVTAFLMLCCSTACAQAGRSDYSLVVSDAAKPVSRDLFGIFYEDLNYAADGGLYAELVQNRSFSYSSADNKAWNSLTAWRVEPRDGEGDVIVLNDANAALHPNNPDFARFTVRRPGAALINSGFDGISVKAGERYLVSFFARSLNGRPQTMNVRLEDEKGAELAAATIEGIDGQWKKFSATLTSTNAARTAQLALVPISAGEVALDMVSLFPERTFRSRPNGLRADLAQTIADLKPRFVRFPGGCLAHGDGLANMYRWKETIGPVEQRKGQPNIWSYHQSVGLGYFEYFQFCEDIGAMPLPVVPAGVCCQNSGAKETGKWGQGQQGLPLEQMPAYIQEVLDLIEYANGPATSEWGAKRAAAGHPEPFHLKYLGVGNEDHITDTFETRFKMIFDAVREKHPEIVVIGTSGPFHSGPDYDNGWAIARKLNVPVVDEHYYVPPEWFWDNLGRYDRYDRNGPKCISVSTRLTNRSASGPSVRRWRRRHT